MRNFLACALARSKGKEIKKNITKQHFQMSDTPFRKKYIHDYEMVKKIFIQRNLRRQHLYKNVSLNYIIAHLDPYKANSFYIHFRMAFNSKKNHSFFLTRLFLVNGKGNG